MQHRTVIVADDLTGACDAAVAYAARGFATYIGLRSGQPPPPDWQIYANNTNTRCAEPDAAAQRASEAFAQAQRLQPERIIKKIDSLMRGNIAVEIAAARAVLQPRITLLAPAFPALGRTVRAGKVWVKAESEPIDIAGRLAGMRCAVVPETALETLSAWSARAIGEGIEILIPETEDEDQMNRLARAAEDIEGLLWVGSGGLTKAIAATLNGAGPTAGNGSPQRPATLPLIKPLLVCCGSDHSVTLAQLADLRRREDTVFAQADASGYLAANRALREGRTAVLLFERPQLNAVAMREFAEQIRIELCGGVLLTGGDTAIGILDALDARGLRVTAEILPGIPRGEILGGAAAGLAFATKSGAFGSPGALSRCVEILRPSRGTDRNAGRQSNQKRRC